MLRLCHMADNLIGMMIVNDTTHERQLTLAEVAGILPGGVSLVTLRRWISDGVRGVRLSASFHGGRWWTTAEAVERFTQEVTRRRLGSAVVPPRRRRDLESYLRDRHGI